MNRAQAVVLVTLVLLAAPPLATVGADVGSPNLDAGSTGVDVPVETAVEADSIEFRITVYENASGRWTFTYTRLLENETQRERFQAFAEEFNENETDTYRQFRTQGRALAANGRNVTGREMSAEDFSRSAQLGGSCVTTQDCGTIRMSFTWSAFAARDDGGLVIGDVFGSGLFLSSNQQLVFETGPGLAFQSASPEEYTPSGSSLDDSDSITYEGERSFSDQRPRVTFRTVDQSGTDGPGTTGSPGNGQGTADPSSPSDEGGFPMALVGGLIVVLVGTGAAIVWWRGEGAGAIVASGNGDGGATGAHASEDFVDDQAVSEEELLTDEDRVLELLQGNGGRMKQVQIVDETGWSKSKVSMLLSEMEDDDQISKLRVGRENIISLAGHEPEAAGSPHEES